MNTDRSTHTCPRCKTEHDTSTSVGGGRPLPQDGDFTICFACNAIGVFVGETGRTTLREATLKDLTDFQKLDPEHYALLDKAHAALVRRLQEKFFPLKTKP